MPPGENDKALNVSPAALRAGATASWDWSKMLRELLPNLRAEVKPGNFPEAAEFARVVNLNVTQLATNTESTANSLYWISYDLNDAATKYEAAHGQNIDEAALIRPMVNDVNQYMPGAAGTLPPPQATTTVQLPKPDANK